MDYATAVSVLDDIELNVQPNTILVSIKLIQFYFTNKVVLSFLATTVVLPLLDIRQNLSKVVITTGFHERNGKKTEVIDLINPKLRCNLLDDIPARAGSIGALMNDKLLICGGVKIGDYYEDCIFIGNSSKTLRMVEGRIFASSVALNETTLLVVGGIGDFGQSLYSTEFIPIDKPPIRDIERMGPDLPFNISSHCTIRYRLTMLPISSIDLTLYIIGITQMKYISLEAEWMEVYPRRLGSSIQPTIF